MIGICLHEQQFNIDVKCSIWLTKLCVWIHACKYLTPVAHVIHAVMLR